MPKLTKEVIIELGKCPFCHASIFEVKNNVVHRNGIYRESWLLLSDGSRMKVGICTECRDIMDEEMVDELMVVHRAFWQKGLERAYKDKKDQLKKQEAEQKAYYKNISATRFGRREKDLE